MTVTESKGLKKGSCVYWRGDATDSGTITATSWDSVTIAWDIGQVAIVHHASLDYFVGISGRQAAARACQPTFGVSPARIR